MLAHEFIRLHQDEWARLRVFLDKAGRVSPAKVPLAEFREGGSLYRRAVSDLAYVRMRYADHPIVKDLEQLVGRAHSILYQAVRSDSRSGRDFWLSTWPNRVLEAARPIVIATSIFWIGAILGFLLTSWNPVLEGLFVSPPMREAIANKRLWTESLTRTAPSAGSQIATHNISVSLLTWGLGLTFGIGTVWLLLLNGLMLGAISAACLRAGMLVPLLEFIVGHGSLELPAIWISGGAGLILAQAMLFPGRYRRGVELRLKGRTSIQIVVGIIPLLLVAGAVEAFVSPSGIPGVVKAALGLCLGLSLVGFVFARGRSRAEQSRPSLATTIS